MLPKITIEQFRILKERLIIEFQYIQKKAENINTDNMTEAEMEKVYKDLLASYNPIYKEIFSYDLSDIPFEEWKDMTIASFDEQDLSKNRANLDFSIIETFDFPNGVNLQNCNLRNLRRLYIPFLEKYFDAKTIAENPEFFLSNSFTPEFKEKFAKSELTIEDLYSLNQEQIKELEEKDIPRKIAYDRTSYATKMIDIFGIELAVKLHQQDTDLFNDIGAYLNRYYSFNYEEIIKEVKNSTNIDKLREEIYQKIALDIKDGSIHPLNNNFSNNFKNRYPELYPQTQIIPEDVMSRFNNRELTIDDIINYGQNFGNINLLPLSKIDYSLLSIANHLGYNFQRLAISYPNELKTILKLLENNDNFNIKYKLESILSITYSISNKELPIEEIKESFIQSLFMAAYGSNFEFSKVKDDSVYEGTSYPDWIKKLGYYVSVVKTFENNNTIPFITKETQITNVNLNNIFNVLGIDNIRRFNSENPYFYPEVLEALSTITLTDLTPVNSYEEFQNKLAEIINKYEPKYLYGNNVLTYNLQDIDGPFRENNSNLFIPKEAPKELQNQFYSGTLNLYSILRNPSWIPYVCHLSPEKLGLNIQIKIINSQHQDTQNSETSTLSDFYCQYGTIEGLLIFLQSYSKIGLSDIIQYTIIDANVHNIEEVEKSLRATIRGLILNNSYSYTEDMPSIFKEENPDLFISPDAPASLKSSFYNQYLRISTLIEHPEYIDYLKNINTNLIKDFPKDIYIRKSVSITEKSSLQDIYINKYGLDNFLRFIIQYGPIVSRLSEQITTISDDTKEAIESSLEQAIASLIIKNSNIIYHENYPEHFKVRYFDLFLNLDAPQELKEKLYNRNLSIEDLKNHKDWIEYLEDINLGLINNLPKKIYISNKENSYYREKISFAEFYIRNYGKKAFLKYTSQYGSICSELAESTIELPVNSKEELETKLDEAIYNIIISRRQVVYDENYPEHFKKRFSGLFLPPDAPSDLKEIFYNRKLNIAFLSQNPTYFKYLSNIDLASALTLNNFSLIVEKWPKYNKATREVFQMILEKISQDDLLKILSMYGKYFTDSTINIESFEGDNFKTIQEKIEKDIIDSAENGTLRYDETAPTFIKEALPNYFISPDAPDDLKKFYYGNDSSNSFSFEKIKENEQRWLPFLKGKSLLTPINMSLSLSYNEKQEYIRFKTRFAAVALKLGLERTEVVETMIKAHQVTLMEQWYYKARFLPDTVIMQNFSLDDADKFLSHGKEWSSLMRNKRFAKNIEGREAMLKLAYTFGVFDGDNQGSKKLDSLLNDIPKKLSENDYNKLLYMEENIQSNDSKTIRIGEKVYEKLKETMIIEGLNITDKSIIKMLYHKNGDGTYSLSINPQTYPKTKELIREFMEDNEISSIITPNKAHTMFGSFKMIYDKNFREFLLNNLTFFQENTEYTKYIPAIHEQFREIQVANSNRVLTPKLAISFVEQNKYTSVEVGNEELAQVSSIAGYSQTDFDKLQEIYSYGKSRVVSSIPRIEGTLEDYKYEMLSLTDPLAVAIGTLTDCCQELNNAAEVCMEHSMVSTHGRVFVIRDTKGNIISQSWVWRNGDVLCFDNIEIPDKAFTRAQRKENSQTRKKFTEEVYEVYKKAAQELIEQDEKIYRELLENGKITQEQYDGLRLGKITVGLGYNDIAESLKKNATMDKGRVARPLSFEPPVHLTRGLYINDSTTQYILEERNDRKEYIGDTIPVHYDELKVYDYQTFGNTQFSTLQRLEIQSGREYNYLNTDIDNSSHDNLLEGIANNYETNPQTTKVIIGPNFAIVFDDLQEINLVDIFINKSLSTLQNEKAILQLRLAILQLQKTGKNLNTTRLENNQVKLIEEVLNIDENKLDEERGISHGTN